MAKEAFTNNKRVELYTALFPLLTSMHAEFQELSKKKPSDALNTKKIEIVNRLLTQVLLILEDEPSKPFLDLLDVDDVPQNSDVTLILSQFVAAMNAYYEKYHRHVPGTPGHSWATKDK